MRFKTVLTALTIAAALAMPAGLKAEGSATKAEPASSETKAEQAADTSSETKPVNMDDLSYSIGMEIALNMKSSDVNLNLGMVIEAMQDVHAGKTPRLSEEEVLAVRNQFAAEQQTKQQEMAMKEPMDNQKASDTFLAKNKSEEGVITTASGLQYKILREGDADGKLPTNADRVEVHYKGTFLNGEEFDNSYTRGKPTTFGVTQVIKGWTEGLKLMKTGSKFQFWIPPELAYGQGRPGIPPNSMLIFEVELLSIVK